MGELFLGEGAVDERFEILLGFCDVSGGTSDFQKNISGGMGNDCAEQGPTGAGRFVALHDAAFQESSFHRDDGDLLFSVGF